MKGEIECARMVADSVGGSVECAVTGLPVGLGDHPFEGMEGRISAILFSIPAVKAVAFGDGFDFVTGYGSTHNDAYRMNGGEIVTKSNHCGGIVGGMSTGMPVIFSCGFKPTPSIGCEQESVSLALGAAMLSINAAKGFDYGSGFEGVAQRGSEQNDLFVTDNEGHVHTLTNNSGGIQGGISNGEDIYFRVAFKPVATLLREQATIDKEGHAATVKARGRHDACVLPRAVPVVEAAAAVAVVDMMLDE